MSRADVRIRAAVGNFRVVAPNARESSGRQYPNGDLVVERMKKDSLGGESWVQVARISGTSGGGVETSDGASQEDLREALFRLLFGPTEVGAGWTE